MLRRIEQLAGAVVLRKGQVSQVIVIGGLKVTVIAVEMFMTVITN